MAPPLWENLRRRPAAEPDSEAAPLAGLPRGKAARARAFQRCVPSGAASASVLDIHGFAADSAEILQKVQRIEIQMKHLVNDVFSGEYHSVFKGRGMEFAEVREYMPGDDIRTIDWNVTARSGAPFVKKYVEERELTVMLVVDLSASGVFGSGAQLKREMAAEICSILAFSATKQQRQGRLHLVHRRRRAVHPAAEGQAARAARHPRAALLPAAGPGNRSLAVLQFVGRVLKRRSVVFLVSDFLDPNFEKPLSVIARRHDVIPIVITDAREEQIPDVDLVDVVDAETGEVRTVDTGSPAVREKFMRRARRVQSWRDRIFRRQALDVIELRTDKSYVVPLITFFRRRAVRY